MIHTHGKIILIGEHAVVYNQPAIVCPVFDAVVSVEIHAHPYTMIESDFYTGPIEEANKQFESIQKLIQQLINEFELQPVYIKIINNIPIAAGMGASAAISGAITKAFFQYINQPYTEEDLKTWMTYSEKIAHGNPSGIDMVGILSNQAMLFQKDKHSQPLKFDIDGKLLIVFSNTHGSTKEAVSIVANNLNIDPSLLNKMHDSVILSKQYIIDKDLHRLGYEMNQYQQYLHQLGVSTSLLDTMIQDAKDLGALGAKLSGGGLGGCIIALINHHEVLTKIINHYQQLGYHQQFIIDLKRI